MNFTIKMLRNVNNKRKKKKVKYERININT